MVLSTLFKSEFIEELRHSVHVSFYAPFFFLVFSMVALNRESNVRCPQAFPRMADSA